MSNEVRTHRLIVFTEPALGREDEYNQWYDDVHLREVLEVEGFVAAQRFKLADAQMTGMDSGAPARYMAIYEIEGDHVEEILAKLASGAETMQMSDALEVNSAKAFAFTAIGERLKSV